MPIQLELVARMASIWPNFRQVFELHGTTAPHELEYDTEALVVIFYDFILNHFYNVLGNCPATPNHRPKMMHALRRGASVLKASIPKIKDVNIIDKYSRMIFPVSFLAFNAGYWMFYLLE